MDLSPTGEGLVSNFLADSKWFCRVWNERAYNPQHWGANTFFMNMITTIECGISSDVDDMELSCGCSTSWTQKKSNKLLKIMGFGSHIALFPFDSTKSPKNLVVWPSSRTFLICWQSSFFPPTLPFIATLRCLRISYEHSNTKEGEILKPTSIKWTVPYVTFK